MFVPLIKSKDISLSSYLVLLIYYMLFSLCPTAHCLNYGENSQVTTFPNQLCNQLRVKSEWRICNLKKNIFLLRSAISVPTLLHDHV